MLSDIERKVLRVIGNYSAGRRRTPSVKTGRDRGGIMTVLDVLAREEYIEWQRSEPDKIEVLEAWGVVREIDAVRKRFKLVSDWDSNWVNVEDIVAVTK